MKKKRVLFIMHLPPPIHGASMVGKQIQNSRLVNDDFDCTYINMSASSHIDDVGKFSINKLFFLVKNWTHCIATIIRLRPNLCYITPTSSGIAFYRDFLLIKSIQFLGTKTILHFHNKPSEKWKSKKGNIVLLKQFFKGVKIILLGKELYPEKASFIKEQDVYYCPNGVESVAATPMTSLPKKEAINFLFLSNMIVEKGVHILLLACKNLKKKQLQFKCDFVGDWKDISEKQFKQLVMEYGLQEEVHCHGPKYGDEKKVFFENADVFVFPTYYRGETFGLVLLEAMDYSLPCIATINGAIPSVVQDGVTGFCINQKDSDALTQKMLWCMKHPEKVREMGLAGKKRFEQFFTLEKFEKRFVSILHDMIK